jgi:diguanylate cyclase (GGDEF)-like protein
MHVLSWFDNRTLIACDLLLATIFAIVFFSMRRVYPTLRGIGSIAASFLLGVPGTFLMVSSTGSASDFVTVVVTVSFIFGSFIFLYRGILRFIGSRRSAVIPLLASFLCLIVLYYYSEIQPSIAARLIAISVTIGLIRGLIAVELFRKSPTFTSPVVMRLFAASMSFFAAVSLNRGVLTYLFGAPSDYFKKDLIQTSTLALGVVSVCLTGLFVLILSSNELIAQSRDDSQRDALCGALNRRGIEAKLAAELKHIRPGKQKLSVVLIDIDYFKSINDVQGHAAGDAAIRDVADAVSSRLRGRDHLGRYGGDEFLLILPQTALNVAVVITERLSHAVSNLDLTGRSEPLTLSIGLTEAVPDDDAVTLIARADKALYQAKSDGRNCRRVVMPDPTKPNTGDAAETAYRGGTLMHPIEPTLLQQ